MPNFPISVAPPLVVIGVGVERLEETAELEEPAVDKVGLASAEVDDPLPCTVDVALDEAAELEEAGGVDVVTETLTDDDVPAADEVVEDADNGALTGAGDDEVGGGGLLELAPALGTGATTPPCTVPPACVEVPAALDL